MKVDWHRRNKVLRARLEARIPEKTGPSGTIHPRALLPTKDIIKKPPPLPLTKAQQKAEKRLTKKQRRKLAKNNREW